MAERLVGHFEGWRSEAEIEAEERKFMEWTSVETSRGLSFHTVACGQFSSSDTCLGFRAS